MLYIIIFKYQINSNPNLTGGPYAVLGETFEQAANRLQEALLWSTTQPYSYWGECHNFRDFNLSRAASPEEITSDEITNYLKQKGWL